MLFPLPLHTYMGGSAARLGFRITSAGQGTRGGSLARADPDFALFVRCDGQGAGSWPVLVGDSFAGYGAKRRWGGWDWDLALGRWFSQLCGARLDRKSGRR